MNTSHPFRPTLSVYETARLLGVSAATAYSWVREGDLPSLRLGGRIRIPTAKLADMLGIEASAHISPRVARREDRNDAA